MQDDLPGSEFWVGGDVVRRMSEEESAQLKDQGVRLFKNPQVLLDEVATSALGGSA